MSEQPDRPLPYQVLIRILVERYPDLAAELLRGMGYEVGERPAELPESYGLDPVDAGGVLEEALTLLEAGDADAVDLHYELPGELWMGEATEPAVGMRIGQTILENVHSPDRCAGRHCVLHNPSDHHMREWELVWRGDRRIMERTCPHGIGHPDPDDMAYQRTLPNGDPGVHGCDGCCVPPQ